jgi:hypothetical protein
VQRNIKNVPAAFSIHIIMGGAQAHNPEKAKSSVLSMRISRQKVKTARSLFAIFLVYVTKARLVPGRETDDFV